MRIAILTEYYPGPDHWGRGVYVHTRAAAYLQAGHQVRVYLVSSGGPEEGEYEGVPVIRARLEQASADLEAYAPDVVALHTPYPGVPHTRLAEGCTVPTVLWIHGYEAMITALHGYHHGWERGLSLVGDVRKLWRFRRSLPGAAAVVYVSDWLRRSVERTIVYRHPRTRVIPNPVDTNRFRPRVDRSGNGRLRGLTLRPLDRVHGVDVAIEAFRGLEDTELTIVGRGPDAARLRREIGRSAAPVQLEEVSVPHDRMPDVLARYDYFVSPERKTPTQGVAMCEAMACQLPVIGPRAGGVPEFVRDGQDGYLVHRGRPAALRRAVRQLIAEPDRLREMGRNARERVRATCSAARVVPAELELLGEVAR